jgi:2-methylcitrate dehydratase PrpD
LQEFRVLGIPVLQRKQDEHVITQRVLGVCVKKRANTAAMARRINAHIDETQKRLYPDEVPVSELEMQRQLDVLEQLQAKRRNRA